MKRCCVWGIVMLLAGVAAGCEELGDDALGNVVDDAANNGVNNAANNGVNNVANNGVNNAANNGVNNAVNNGVNNDVDAGPLTYHRDIVPLMAKHCIGCHGDEGIGPFKLDTYEAVVEFAPAIRSSVMEGSMPPWLPEEDCRPFVGERRMSQEEKNTLVGWLDGDRLEGDPADAPEVTTPELNLERVDLVLKAQEPYIASPDNPDDYRCLVLDHDFVEDTYISAYQVVPDKRSIVHHVLFYLVNENDVPRLEALEAEDETQGYRCFGGPRVGDLLGTVAGWVPGSVPTHYPEDSAYIIPAGSKLVMQVHYNLLSEEPQPDHTEVHLTLLDEPPANVIRILPVPVTNLDIPAGEPNARHSLLFPNVFGKTLKIVGTTPHMHMLGKKLEAKIFHNDGSQSCVVDVQDWDFNWQQFYEIDPDHYIDFNAGDTVSVACVHDNSAANQPVVNGQQLEPRDVDWGDGSLDEMCLLYLTTMEPYDGLETCEAFEPCNQSCDPTDPFCTISCMTNGGGDCRTCATIGTVECAQRRCEDEADGLLSCVFGCISEYDLGVCLAERCPEQTSTLWECLGPDFYEGRCDRNLRSCNITFGDP